MDDNLIDDFTEEDWQTRTYRVISSVLYEDHESDWMQAGNCQVEEHEDLRFIVRPTAEEEKEWEAICKQCPVALQCLEWADREQPTNVYVAGEWRE